MPVSANRRSRHSSQWCNTRCSAGTLGTWSEHIDARIGTCAPVCCTMRPIDRRLEYLYNKEAIPAGGGFVVHSVDFDDRISPLSRRLVPDQMWALVQPLIPTP